MNEELEEEEAEGEIPPLFPGRIKQALTGGDNEFDSRRPRGCIRTHVHPCSSATKGRLHQKNFTFFFFFLFPWGCCIFLTTTGKEGCE